ncbi:HAD family hydrolase [Chachezhania antarctica]|uniref:HAD family hydrolase n=1 Tax=Chachezhania antarctica TaxID=2340860 RepID=UPI000EB3EAB5|nr:HAD family hydrolase [Chachezhania antarctica]
MRTLLPLATAFAVVAGMALADPLPSWEDGASKTAIVTFVENVTDPTSDSFVPEASRIATFDNDGTLWAEKPVYFQFLFAIDRLKEMAKADPSVLSSDVLKAAADGDMKTVAASGEKGLLEIIGVTHSGMSVDDFDADAKTWLATAEHPQKHMPITSMTYQPMLELLTYLRDEGFRTYIVSGGGMDFIRSFSDDAYNIPASQVVGSMGNYEYSVKDGTPQIDKTPGLFFNDDKTGKPLGIQARIGQRPILAVGNSDGDFEMLQWTTAGDGQRLGMIVHHTDADREWAYDRDSHVGKLDKALDAAPDEGWIVVDMKNDWKRIWSGK